MEVHVICCNDSIEYAVAGDIKKAEAKLLVLRNKDIERKRSTYGDESSTIKEYKDIYYWHIHSVEGE